MVLIHLSLYCTILKGRKKIEFEEIERERVWKEKERIERERGREERERDRERGRRDGKSRKREREIFLSRVLISVFSFRTPLMLACYDGSITPIRMLLQFNAQMVIKDKKGQLSWEQQGYKLGTPIL